METEKVEGCDLVPGDVVQLDTPTYNTATVKNVEGNIVTLVRPFIHTSDTIYTGGVLTYTGVETFVSSGMFTRVDKSRVPKHEHHNIFAGKALSFLVEKRRGHHKDCTCPICTLVSEYLEPLK